MHTEFKYNIKEYGHLNMIFKQIWLNSFGKKKKFFFPLLPPVG